MKDFRVTVVTSVNSTYKVRARSTQEAIDSVRIATGVQEGSGTHIAHLVERTIDPPKQDCYCCIDWED